MEVVLSIVVGVLFAAAVYLMLARNLMRFLFGLILISNAANLALFTAGRLTEAAPPLIAEGADGPAGVVANALPQALVLTAIVIGFALVCFALVLVVRVIRDVRTDDALELRQAEPLPDHPVKPPASAADCDVAWPPSEGTP